MACCMGWLQVPWSPSDADWVNFFTHDGIFIHKDTPKPGNNCRERLNGAQQRTGKSDAVSATAVVEINSSGLILKGSSVQMSVFSDNNLCFYETSPSSLAPPFFHYHPSVMSQGGTGIAGCDHRSCYRCRMQKLQKNICSQQVAIKR